MAVLETTTQRPAQPEMPINEIPPGTRYVPDQLLTVDEFYELIDERSHAELDDGVIVMPSPVSLDTRIASSSSPPLLRGFVRARGLGLVLGSRDRGGVAVLRGRAVSGRISPLRRLLGDD